MLNLIKELVVLVWMPVKFVGSVIGGYILTPKQVANLPDWRRERLYCDLSLIVVAVIVILSMLMMLAFYN